MESKSLKNLNYDPNKTNNSNAVMIKKPVFVGSLIGIIVIFGVLIGLIAYGCVKIDRLNSELETVSSSETRGPGGFGGGTPPDMDGEMPEFDEENPPELPDGEVPEGGDTPPDVNSESTSESTSESHSSGKNKNGRKSSSSNNSSTSSESGSVE